MFWELDEIEKPKTFNSDYFKENISDVLSFIKGKIKRGFVLTDDQFKNINVFLKMEYLFNQNESGSIELTPMQLYYQAELLKTPKHIIQEVINDNLCDFSSFKYIWQFNWCKTLIGNKTILNDEEFSFIVNEDIKPFLNQYFSDRINEGCGLSKLQFNHLSEKQKLKYVISASEYSKLKPHEDEWYKSKLKN